MSRHNNKGQRDGSKNKYRPPHDRGLLGDLIFGHNKTERKDRSEYNGGWKNGYKGRK